MGEAPDIPTDGTTEGSDVPSDPRRRITPLLPSPATAVAAGTCVDAFDEDGVCLRDELPWADVTGFAQAEESASVMSREAFVALSPLPAHLRDLPPETTRYLRSDDGVLMVHDVEEDVHHFFAGTRPATPARLTLYRCEPDLPACGRRPACDASDWRHQRMRESGQWDALGRWFTDSPETLGFYALDVVADGFRIVSVTVDAEEAARWRVDTGPGRRFSRDPDTGFLVPREVAEAATKDRSMTEEMAATLTAPSP